MPDLTTGDTAGMTAGATLGRPVADTLAHIILMGCRSKYLPLAYPIKGLSE